MESQIILASSSPRRIEMIKNIGISPVILPSTADEALPFPLSMEQAVMFLALKKALNVEKLWLENPVCGQQLCSGQDPDDMQVPSVIIAADTIVYKNGMIGKPADRSDAFNTLRLLRNTSHFVATGVALVRPGESKRSVFYDTTEVFFKDYSDGEIEGYLDTDEPWDKAGSYAIQGAWGKYVSHITGSYDNVMGFPLEKIQLELKTEWPEIALSTVR